MTMTEKESVELDYYLRKILVGRTEEESELIMAELRRGIEEILETGEWSGPNEDITKILSAANTKDFVKSN